jgi:hypothetical protein
MHETGTRQSADASVWQSTAGLAFVNAVVAIVMTLQPSSVQAGMRAGAEIVDTALVLAVDL